VEKECEYMNKPVNLLIEDTRQQIIKILVDTKLPAKVTKYIIDDIKNEVDRQTIEIMAKERIEYQKLLNEELKSNESEDKIE
jgi:hypothetical protein